MATKFISKEVGDGCCSSNYYLSIFIILNACVTNTLHIFVQHRNPNLGRRKLPIVVDNVDSLPRWSRHSGTKEECLDVGSFFKMTLRTKSGEQKEQKCEFLKDPEEFLQQETSGSTKNSPAKWM